MYFRVLNWMSTHVSKVRAASIIRTMALMMEAARTSETSVDIQLRTRQHIPEDSELQQLIRTMHSKTKFIKSKYR
jgi:hypothetical protein